MGESERLEFGFERAGVGVAVRAELWSNDDPAAYGCPDFARGFPVLRATIEPPGRGYQDLLGWIQLIHDPERSDGFLIDALEMLSEVTHPFGYFGYAPILFDAPHRPPDEDLDWVAHTFLGSIGGIYGECDAHAYLGFSWGYRIRAGKPSLVGFEQLGPAAWDAHLPYLRARCPDWTFASGYREPRSIH